MIKKNSPPSSSIQATASCTWIPLGYCARANCCQVKSFKMLKSFVKSVLKEKVLVSSFDLSCMKLMLITTAPTTELEALFVLTVSSSPQRKRKGIQLATVVRHPYLFCQPVGLKLGTLVLPVDPHKMYKWPQIKAVCLLLVTTMYVQVDNKMYVQVDEWNAKNK